jgi:CheY-like chemotaxis protein
LPVLDGFEIFEQIRNIDPVVPVIGFSAHAMDSELRKAEAAGFSAYITKPVMDWNHFTGTILRLIDAAKR